MSDYTTINLADADLFSQLSYADQTWSNSIAWGLAQPASGTAFLAANALYDAGWTDQTQALCKQYLGGNSRAWHDISLGGTPSEAGNNQFRVLINTNTKQISVRTCT